MPQMLMVHDDDPKQEVLDKIGDISGFTVFHTDVLVALYMRPEKTKSGLILTDRTREEDRWQGKAGLVIKMGNDAFKDPNGLWFTDAKIELHDWVWFRPSDGFPITLNSREGFCRVINDVNVRGTLPHPDMIW